MQALKRNSFVGKRCDHRIWHININDAFDLVRNCIAFEMTGFLIQNSANCLSWVCFPESAGRSGRAVRLFVIALGCSLRLTI